MIRQLWHVLFDHPWRFDYTLPVKFYRQFDIAMNEDIIMETHYSRCRCGLIRQGWSAYTL